VARVAVDVPLAHLDRPFDYRVPEHLDADAVPGVRLRVRFAGRQVDGYLLERVAESGHDGRLAWVDKVVSGEPVLTAEVAALCRAVGMRVIAHDPAASNDDGDGIELVPLSELVARADVITLHCSLTRETRGLVDSSFLSRVGPGAVLVNVARGEIVESDDVLAEALVSGRLSAVALDVYPTEPPQVEHRLYSDPRVICTPHSVGLTQRWNEQVFRSLAKGVQSVLAGKRPPNLLNPDSMS
jgi:phosphoglycerate dehydrogenase-like enzyme